MRELHSDTDPHDVSNAVVVLPADGSGAARRVFGGSDFGGPGEDKARAKLYTRREGDLIRTPGELWFHSDAVERLRNRVIERIRENGPLETPAYKDLIGTTRRTAMPLMELFDAERVTLRRDNARVLRGG